MTTTEQGSPSDRRQKADRSSTRSLGLGLIALVVIVGLWGSVAGCGYALVGRASNIPDDIQKVHLAPFENLTPRVQIEQFLTQAIAEELVTRRRFSLVDADQADAVLSGAVVSFRATPLTVDAEGRAEEYEISVTARVSFKRPGADEAIWSNDRYLFRENYELEAAQADFFDRENLALEETARRFAETMVTDLLEGF